MRRAEASRVSRFLGLVLTGLSLVLLGGMIVLILTVNFGPLWVAIFVGGVLVLVLAWVRADRHRRAKRSP